MERMKERKNEWNQAKSKSDFFPSHIYISSTNHCKNNKIRLIIIFHNDSSSYPLYILTLKKT